MQLMPNYRYYCQWPDRTLPGFLVKVEAVDDLDLDEWLSLSPNYLGEPNNWEYSKATITAGGTQHQINTAWFIEPSTLEWRLADAFDRLGWSRAKQTNWCNKLFPVKRGSLKLLAQGIYGLDECSHCIVGYWQPRQLKIAVEMAEKLVRRRLKLTTKFKHPLAKHG